MPRNKIRQATRGHIKRSFKSGVASCTASHAARSSFTARTSQLFASRSASPAPPRAPRLPGKGGQHYVPESDVIAPYKRERALSSPPTASVGRRARLRIGLRRREFLFGGQGSK